MVKVYIAGAYSDDNVIGVLRNIGRGEYYAAKLFALGFAPFCPWHDKDFVIKNWDKPMNLNNFYEYSLEWLRVSDCVYIIPDNEFCKDYKDSKGTLNEILEAEKYGIPVFYNLIDICMYYRGAYGNVQL